MNKEHNSESGWLASLEPRAASAAWSAVKTPLPIAAALEGPFGSKRICLLPFKQGVCGKGMERIPETQREGLTHRLRAVWPSLPSLPSTLYSLGERHGQKPALSSASRPLALHPHPVRCAVLLHHHTPHTTQAGCIRCSQVPP